MRPDLALRRMLSKTNQPTGAAGCWLWIGCADKDGYGHTRLFGERRAHRASFVAHSGPIPAGVCVLHRCDMPACINPAHLFLGTPAENMHDRKSKGRYLAGDAHHWHARPETVRRGERHPAAKLTAAQVAEIRAAYVSKYGAQTALARKYGVTQGAIWRVIRNLNHKES